AALFVTTMVVWMWRTGRHIKKEIEKKIDSLVARESSWRMRVGVFLFAFLMVVREGIETVIFLRAVTSGEGLGWAAVGVIAGASLAVVFGFLFVRGSMRIDIGRFLKVTAVVLLVFVAQLIVNGLHEFYELGVFPASPEMMSILGPIVRNNLLFIFAIISIPALMFVIPERKRVALEPSPSNRRWQLGAGIASLSLICFLGFSSLYNSGGDGKITPAQRVVADNGVISLPVVGLLDGGLHRFYWMDEDGTEIRFFALRAVGGSFATAFDACRACYNYGYYYLDGGELICSVCEAPTEMTKLAVAAVGDEELSGSMEGLGCAPLFLQSRLKAGSLQLTVKDLMKNKKYFQTNHVPQAITEVADERTKSVH
ncbi:MAG: Fe-S-containing protein, partial [Bacteroidota bacterium]